MESIPSGDYGYRYVWLWNNEMDISGPWKGPLNARYAMQGRRNLMGAAELAMCGIQLTSMEHILSDLRKIVNKIVSVQQKKSSICDKPATPHRCGTMGISYTEKCKIAHLKEGD